VSFKKFIAPSYLPDRCILEHPSRSCRPLAPPHPWPAASWPGRRPPAETAPPAHPHRRGPSPPAPAPSARGAPPCPGGRLAATRCKHTPHTIHTPLNRVRPWEDTPRWSFWSAGDPLPWPPLRFRPRARYCILLSGALGGVGCAPDQPHISPHVDESDLGRWLGSMRVLCVFQDLDSPQQTPLAARLKLSATLSGRLGMKQVFSWREEANASGGERTERVFRK
jgi:hypothetical protein